MSNPFGRRPAIFVAGVVVVGILLTGVRSGRSAPLGSGIEQLAWLAGCWQAQSPGRLVEEHWLGPRGDCMIGVSRTVRADTLLEYELIVLRERPGGELAYEAHPSGQRVATFIAREVTDMSIVFENPKHDFPQRVGYTRRGADSLIAWIEGEKGGEVRRVEFPYVRVGCP
jgi:hypothetical protein